MLEHTGTSPLRELTAHDVRRGLEALSDRISTRYLQIAPASLAWPSGALRRTIWSTERGHVGGQPRRTSSGGRAGPLLWSNLLRWSTRRERRG